MTATDDKAEAHEHSSEAGFADRSEIYGRALLYSVATIVVFLAVAAGVPALKLTGHALWTDMYIFIQQDLLFLAFLLVPLFATPTALRAQRTEWLNRLSSLSGTAAIALALFLVCLAGHYLVFQGYSYTRDEQMADFDAYIFAHGRLFWPIPPFWRHFAPALDQTYILPIGNHEAWVSEYLPMNAALRALVGLVASPSLTGPLLTAVGAFALWKITVRLWPDSPSTRLIALLLYAGSAQVLLNGMTSFAMPAHLTFDLVWLALFIQDRRYAHGGAALVGFFATGLHQPIFHPLFAIPFIGLLAVQRRWRLFVFYVASYALIAAFWIAWPVWLSSHGTSPVADNGHGVGVLGRLATTLIVPEFGSLWLMALNILRFVTCQHVLLLPLLAMGARTAWRQGGLAGALAAGLVLPIPVMLVLQAEQGFGWGYRYLHGEIANACLLAAYGWRDLEILGLSLRRAVIWSSVATFAVVIPARFYAAHRTVEHWVSVDHTIASTNADVAIVDDTSVTYINGIALNKPDLSNRPIILLASRLQAPDIARLCAKASIAFFDAPRLLPPNDTLAAAHKKTSAQEIGLMLAARRLNCRVVPPG